MTTTQGKASGKQSEWSNFESALKKVLSVSHAEMKSKLDAEKRTRPKRAASRVSRSSRAND